MFSRFIHVIVHAQIPFPLKLRIFYWMHILHLVCSLICWWKPIVSISWLLWLTLLGPGGIQLCPQDSTFNYSGYVARSRIDESFHRTPIVFLPSHLAPPFLSEDKSIISIVYRTEQTRKTTEGPLSLPPAHIKANPSTLWRRRPLSSYGFYHMAGEQQPCRESN